MNKINVDKLTDDEMKEIINYIRIVKELWANIKGILEPLSDVFKVMYEDLNEIRDVRKRIINGELHLLDTLEELENNFENKYGFEA